ncbi:MAG: hypothetical protein ACI8W3_002476, partial [Myxococcota bacterium]
AILNCSKAALDSMAGQLGSDSSLKSNAAIYALAVPTAKRTFFSTCPLPNGLKGGDRNSRRTTQQ